MTDDNWKMIDIDEDRMPMVEEKPDNDLMHVDTDEEVTDENDDMVDDVENDVLQLDEGEMDEAEEQDDDEVEGEGDTRIPNVGQTALKYRLIREEKNHRTLKYLGKVNRW